MKKLLLLFFITLTISQQAEITNIQASQRTDGSQIVDITYDLLPDPVFEFFEIIVLVSLDGGENYTPMMNVSGDLGDIVEPGNGKTLTWNFGQQFGGTYSNQIKIKIQGSSYALVDNNSNQELPFEMVTVAAGEYTFGENDDIRTIDYDYEIMKYEVTDQDYVLFMLDQLSSNSEQGITNSDCLSCINQGNYYCLAGGEWGDCIFWGWVNDDYPDCYDGADENFNGLSPNFCFESSFGASVNNNRFEGYYPGDANYPAGDYPYLNFNESKISWNGEIFEVQEGNVNHPVTGVTWFGAWAFATHYGMEIPDQYEWEKAARGNTGYNYPWGDEITNQNSNYDELYTYGLNTGNLTTPTGLFSGLELDCSEDPLFYDDSNSSLYNENYNVTFVVDMSNYNLSPNSVVTLNGSFNDWCGYCDNVMSDLDGDDLWELSLQLPSGTYEYQFTINGWEVLSNLSIGSSCDFLPDDPYPNYGFNLEENDNLILGPYCFGTCLLGCNNTYECPFTTIDSPSPYGAYDMAGNVLEIVKNDDDSYFIRGGAFNSDASQLQSWYQESYNGSSSSNNIGFRCMRIINQSQSRIIPKEKLKEHYLNKKNNTQKSNIKK